MTHMTHTCRHAPTATTGPEEALAGVIECIAEVLRIDIATITPARPLSELGARSFDLVELVVKLEQRYGIQVRLDHLPQGIQTAEGFARLVGARGHHGHPNMEKVPADT